MYKKFINVYEKLMYIIGKDYDVLELFWTVEKKNIFKMLQVF